MQDVEGWSWKRVSTQSAERDGARPPVVALTFGGKVGFFFFFFLIAIREKKEGIGNDKKRFEDLVVRSPAW